MVSTKMCLLELMRWLLDLKRRNWHCKGACQGTLANGTQSRLLLLPVTVKAHTYRALISDSAAGGAQDLW